MQGYQYQSDFARKYYGQGREEGLRAAVVALARTKLKELSADDIAAIEAMSDQLVLTELITSLGQARSARKARAALDRALNLWALDLRLRAYRWLFFGGGTAIEVVIVDSPKEDAALLPRAISTRRNPNNLMIVLYHASWR
jgi:hypothetical protein